MTLSQGRESMDDAPGKGDVVAGVLEAGGHSLVMALRGDPLRPDPWRGARALRRHRVIPGAKVGEG
jgi:hypothetical protein